MTPPGVTETRFLEIQETLDPGDEQSTVHILPEKTLKVKTHATLHINTIPEIINLFVEFTTCLVFGKRSSEIEAQPFTSIPDTFRSVDGKFSGAGMVGKGCTVLCGLFATILQLHMLRFHLQMDFCEQHARPVFKAQKCYGGGRMGSFP